MIVYGLIFLERINKPSPRHAIFSFFIQLLADTCHAYLSQRTDGGGIRGYSALLILQELMKAIGRRERTHPDGTANSSYYPLMPPPKTPEETAKRRMDNVAEDCVTESSPWLPCHYFDYMAGTSTGGYTYLELRCLILTNFPVDLLPPC